MTARRLSGHGTWYCPKVGLRIAVKCDTNSSARRTQTLVPRECSKVKSKRWRRVPQFSLKNSGGGLRDSSGITRYQI